MEQESSPTDAFERELARGRDALSDASNTYSSVLTKRTVPDSLVEAIGGLEERFDELDQTLNVDWDDVKTAKQTAQKAILLADVFDALEQRQRAEIETELTRLESYATGLNELRSDADFSDNVQSEFERINRQIRMLQKLAEDDRYGQIVSNERISPSTVDVDLRALEAELSETTSYDKRARVYLSTCEELLEPIHKTLAELDDANKDKTAYGSELKTIKEHIDGAETKLEGDEPSKASELARAGLEGVFMIHQQIGAAGANAELAGRLTAMLKETDEEVHQEVEEASARGDVDTLLDVFSELIGTQVERSVTDRLNQLLREHDGSVAKTVEATDFDTETVLTHLEQLYQQPDVSDIEVIFG